MKFTIVTPSFNQAKFVERCVNSVVDQAYAGVEHIVLDNCSTDGTAEILRDYAMARHDGISVHLFVEPDGGQTSAINKGFRLATGDAICWLNTDEWLLPGALSAVSNFFAANQDVDIVFGNCEFVDLSSGTSKVRKEHFFSKDMLLYYGCFVPSCTTFVRRRAIDEGILLDESYRVTMDYEWYVRLATSGYRFEHLDVVLAAFTWHDSNISAVQGARRRQERLRVQEEYGRLPAPAVLRPLAAEALRAFWLLMRASRRTWERLK